MTEEDDRPPRRRATDATCVDKKVRSFLSAGTWDVESDASKARFFEAWHVLFDIVERTQRRRPVRSAIMVALVGALASTCLAVGIPYLLRMLGK